MSEKKISELDAFTSLSDDDVLIANDGSTTKSITWAYVKTAVQTAVEAFSSYFNKTSDTLDDITNGSTYVKSTNDFTDADHSKLDGIEASATADQTGAEIKSAYEGESDTNAYTDAEKTKLAGVEASADVTDATNVASAGAVMNSGNETIAGVKTFSSDPIVPEEVYGAGWNGSLEPPTKNAVYDKIETIGGGADADAIHDNESGEISAITGKTTPVDADVALIEDSAASNAKKKVTWANIKATLKTYFDTLYAGVLGADDNYVTDAEKTVIGNTSGTNTGDEASASDSTAGVVELATTAETNTGTDTGRAVTPDGLAGSVHGKKAVSVLVVEPSTDAEADTDLAMFSIPSALNGMNLVAVHAEVKTAGTTGVSTVDINNNGTSMLSTKLTIDSGETGSDTAATSAVIDTGQDDVSTYDVITIDVDGVSTTAPKGLVVTMEFQLP